MEEPNDRLRIARQNAGFEDAASAARAYGWNVHTYRSHENGTRGIPAQAARRYARMFKVSAGWILTGEKTAVSNNQESSPAPDTSRLRPIIEAAVQSAIQFFGVELSPQAQSYLSGQIESILKDKPIRSVPLDQEGSDRARTEIAVQETLKQFFAAGARDKASLRPPRA